MCVGVSVQLLKLNASNVLYIFMAKTKAHAFAVNFVETASRNLNMSDLVFEAISVSILLLLNLKKKKNTHWCGSKPQRNTQCVTLCLDPYWCALISSMEKKISFCWRGLFLNALKYRYYADYSAHPKQKHIWLKKENVWRCQDCWPRLPQLTLLTKNSGLKCFDPFTLTHTQVWIVCFVRCVTCVYSKIDWSFLSCCFPDLPPHRCDDRLH